MSFILLGGEEEISDVALLLLIFLTVRRVVVDVFRPFHTRGTTCCPQGAITGRTPPPYDNVDHEVVH